MEPSASASHLPTANLQLAWPGYPAAGFRQRCLVSAEIGNIHDGSLGNVHALIDAAAAAGADCIKLQCHVAGAESTEAEQFPRRFSFHPQDASRTDYWRRMEFSRSQWEGIAYHVRQRELELIVSPFSIEGLARIADLADRIKIASGEVNHAQLLEAIGQCGKPTVISTGMSAEQDASADELGVHVKSDAATNDINRAVHEHLKPKRREDCIVLQCATAYPCPLKWIGLNKVYQYSRQQFVLGGLSDHSGLIWPGVAAAVLGAHMVEVHVCWDKRQFGADAASSLTIDQLRQLVDGVRAVEVMRRNPVDKNAVLAELEDVNVYRTGKKRG